MNLLVKDKVTEIFYTVDEFFIDYAEEIKRPAQIAASGAKRTRNRKPYFFITSEHLETSSTITSI